METHLTRHLHGRRQWYLKSETRRVSPFCVFVGSRTHPSPVETCFRTPRIGRNGVSRESIRLVWHSQILFESKEDTDSSPVEKEENGRQKRGLDTILYWTKPRQKPQIL